MLQWVSAQEKTRALAKGAVEKMTDIERLMGRTGNVDL